jgi:2-(1,2-epoxy-1,2-dihydrophenyl)acetyl-CoA isomerase
MDPDEPEVAGERCVLTREGDIAVVTISKPRRRNCLSLPVLEDFVQVFDALRADETCRAVVLTGSGNYFCASGDVTAMAELDLEGPVGRLGALHALPHAITRLPVPVVAAVEGGAAGGGLSLAAACDIVAAADDARLVLAFDRIALATDLGALYFFERRMGLGATCRIAYLDSSMTASEAVELGLMDELARPGSARARALEIATQIAARSRTARGRQGHAGRTTSVPCLGSASRAAACTAAVRAAGLSPGIARGLMTPARVRGGVRPRGRRRHRAGSRRTDESLVSVRGRSLDAG